MTAVLGVLMVFCLVMILIGLIRPTAAIRWGRFEKRRRGKVLGIYGTVLILLFFLIGVTTETEEKAAPVTASEQPSESDQDAQESRPSELDSAAVEPTPASAENKVYEPEATEPAPVSVASNDEDHAVRNEWNTTEPDAIENGNFYTAVEMIRALGNIPDGQVVAAEEVLKAPWDYYGQPLTFTGTIEVVQDLPPGSDDYQAGRQSDIVMAAEDDTIVEFFIMIPSNGMKIGQTVTLTGYPIGRSEVDNALGGTYTHLIMVTNELE